MQNRRPKCTLASIATGIIPATKIEWVGQRPIRLSKRLLGAIGKRLRAEQRATKVVPRVARVYLTEDGLDVERIVFNPIPVELVVPAPAFVKGIRWWPSARDREKP
jgi:hypothetical protein